MMKMMTWTAVAGVMLGALTGGVSGQETFKVDLAAVAAGPVPKETLFVVEGAWQAADKDGVKCLQILPEPITDANAQTGPSAKGDAAISARVFASKRARSYPRFGVSVHGMSGYRLMVNAAKKQVELIKADELVASAPFEWVNDSWVNLKLEAVRKSQDGPWSITASAWNGVDAPAEPLLRHEDVSGMKGTGKCGLWGTPYSELPIYFAEVTGSVKVEG